MGETSSEIRRQIDEERHSLGENLSELEERAKRAVDWRARLKHRPLAAFGLAVGAGALVGALSVRSYTSHVVENDLGQRIEPPKGGYPRNPLWTSRKKKMVNTLDTLTDAVVGVATAKVTDFLNGLIPGFGEHFDKAERERSRDV
jgi:hypothetical protein